MFYNNYKLIASICRFLTLISAAMLMTFGHATADLVNPWGQVKDPAHAPVKIIGTYAGGCIQGAVSLLPDEGPFELMRQSRHRYFAHPRMRQFILWLATQVHEHGYGKLLVGDIGQPRGGPATTGHASHQIGLDADFWFWLGAQHLSTLDKEQLSAPSMLNSTQTAVDPGRLKDAQIHLLEIVSEHPQVERIFVNPLIKKALCERTGAANWLRKVRPWWGHHYHFHVRLGCPADQDACEHQEPPPETSGCDAELDSWLKPKNPNEDEAAKAEKRLTPEQRLAAKLAKVPEGCTAILHFDK